MTQGLEFDASDLLVGVSFGGIVVQEIARQYPILERIVVLSSAVSVAEYPGFVRFLRALKFYRLFPGGIFRNRQLRAYLVTGQRGEKGVRRFRSGISVLLYGLAWSSRQPMPLRSAVCGASMGTGMLCSPSADLSVRWRTSPGRPI